MIAWQDNSTESGKEILMKLLHLGDLHIGKSVNDYSMIEDQEFILDQILQIGAEHGVDGILIAGDVYDKSVPSEEAVRVFDRFLCQMAERKMKAFIISGNHDSDERLHFGSDLFASHDIYIASKYEGTLSKQTIMDEHGPFNIYLLPFVKASQVRHFFPDREIDSYDQAVRAAIGHETIDGSQRNILLAHQFVAGRSGEVELAGSENAAVQHVGAVERIGADCFDAFDYVALGHIHSPQRVAGDRVRYSGSPLKYSLSEISNEKSVPVITFGKKGEVTVDLVPLKPLRDMRHIKGKMEQILRREHILSPEDYIYVTLTDEAPISDAMAIIRQHYPNAMKVDYENSRTGEGKDVDVMEASAGKSFREMIYGREISREEEKIMMEVAGEAGVADEAD